MCGCISQPAEDEALFHCVLCCAVQAGKLFKQLKDLGEESLKKGGLDMKKVELHANFCVDNTPKVGGPAQELFCYCVPS